MSQAPIVAYKIINIMAILNEYLAIAVTAPSASSPISVIAVNYSHNL
jgi:hypothetical protein